MRFCVPGSCGETKELMQAQSDDKCAVKARGSVIGDVVWGYVCALEDSERKKEICGLELIVVKPLITLEPT